MRHEAVESVSSVRPVKPVTYFVYNLIKMVIKNINDLDVYRESLKILPEVYEFLRSIPKSELDSIYQIKRATKAIPAIISEGFAKRNSSKEFKRYLLIAIGSSDEVITHLRVISILIPDLADKANILINKFITISKRLNALHKKWDVNNFRSSPR